MFHHILTYISMTRDFKFAVARNSSKVAVGNDGLTQNWLSVFYACFIMADHILICILTSTPNTVEMHAYTVYVK